MAYPQRGFGEQSPLSRRGGPRRPVHLRDGRQRERKVHAHPRHPVPRLLYELNGTRTTWAPHSALEGTEQLDKIIDIDQSPIRRTPPRSNPATYTGTFDMVRELFALTPDAKMRGYKNGRFSFNVDVGRSYSLQESGYYRITGCGPSNSKFPSPCAGLPSSKNSTVSASEFFFTANIIPSRRIPSLSVP